MSGSTPALSEAVDVSEALLLPDEDPSGLSTADWYMDEEARDAVEEAAAIVDVDDAVVTGRIGRRGAVTSEDEEAF